MSRAAFKRAASAAFLTLAGCGTAFVEPHPPELEILHLTLTQEVRNEPVVLGYFFDLQIPDQSVCRDSLDQISKAHLGSGKEEVRAADVRSLPSLAPDCQQVWNKRLPLADLRLAFEKALSYHPTAVARPVIVYVNNIDAPLSSAFVSDFQELSLPLSNGMRAEIWALAPASVAQQLKLTRHIEWTWANDPDLPHRIDALLDERLPFWSTLQDSVEIPALPDDLVGRARAMKVCTHGPEIQGGSVPLDGSPAFLDAASPPMLDPPRWSTRFAQPWPPTPDQTSWTVEVCVASCDRAIETDDGRPGPWWSKWVGCTAKVSP